MGGEQARRKTRRTSQVNPENAEEAEGRGLAPSASYAGWRIFRSASGSFRAGLEDGQNRLRLGRMPRSEAPRISADSVLSGFDFSLVFSASSPASQRLRVKYRVCLAPIARLSRITPEC